MANYWILLFSKPHSHQNLDVTVTSVIACQQRLRIHEIKKKVFKQWMHGQWKETWIKALLSFTASQQRLIIHETKEVLKQWTSVQQTEAWIKALLATNTECLRVFFFFKRPGLPGQQSELVLGYSQWSKGDWSDTVYTTQRVPVGLLKYGTNTTDPIHLKV